MTDPALAILIGVIVIAIVAIDIYGAGKK